MTFDDDYVAYAAAQAATRARLDLRESLVELIDRWADFVAECERGYRWDVSEYDNEVRVRGRLGALVDAPELRDHAIHRELAAQAAALDDRLRAMLLPGVARSDARPWWEAGVLRRAGEEYARCFPDVTGIEVLPALW